MRSSKLCLVRHGAPEGPPDRCIGWTDLLLRDPAETAAKLAAQPWERARAVVSSDLVRAQDTAAQLLRHHPQLRALGPQPDLRELNFGDWEGLSWAQVEAQDPAGHAAFFQDWRHGRPPGGESWVELKARCARWLQTASPVDGTVIVAHYSSLRALFSLLTRGETEPEAAADLRAFSQSWDHAQARWLSY